MLVFLYDEWMTFASRFFASICTLFLLMLLVPHAEAATLSGALIRLDRTKAGIAPGPILVEITPTTVATEGKVVFQLDSRWTSGTHFSTSASSYTTTTAGIPSGFTALPLQSATATSISGHTLTFSINDLTVGTPYAFFITGGFPLNASAAEYLTVLSTQTAGSSPIDSQNVWIETSVNDQIVVNATVPSASTNLTVTLTPEQNNDTNRQDSTLDFTIVYGSDAALTGPLTLQASWDLGTPEGQAVPTQDILAYVDGSAGNAYGGTVPVINTSNRTITWSIPSYPSGLPNQSVRFSLKTTSTYTGEKRVGASVHAQIPAPVQSSISSYNVTYLYVPTTESPQGTSVPTTSEPTVSQVVPQFSSVSLTSVRDSSAQFSVSVSSAAQIAARYGTSPRNLSLKVTTSEPALKHQLRLPDLKPETDYYVIFDAIVDGVRVATSDTYTFQTAQTKTDFPKILTDSLVVLQDGSPVYGKPSLEGSTQKITVVANQVIDLQLTIAQSNLIGSAVASLRSASVLGLTDDQETEPDLSQTTLTEIATQRYVGKMRTPSQVGLYYLVLRIETKTGDIEETHLATIRLVPPMIVVDQDGKPIENVKAVVKRFDERSRLYIPITAGSTQIRSTLRSDEKGLLAFNLSEGKYEIALKAIGYTEKTIPVVIEFSDANPYDTVTLKEIPLSFALLVSYYSNIGDNIFHTLRSSVHTVSSSPRFWDLFFFATLVAILFFILSSVSLRLGIPMVELLPALIQHLQFERAVHARHIFHGTIHNSLTDEAIAGARVSLHNSDRKQLKSFAKTNILGEFALIVPTGQKTLCFDVQRKGFEALSECAPSDFTHAHPLKLRPSATNYQFKVRDFFNSVVYVLIDFSLEFLIVAALLCELYLLLTNRIALFSTFFVLTLICIGTWAIWKHLWHTKMNHLQSW